MRGVKNPAALVAVWHCDTVAVVLHKGKPISSFRIAPGSTVLDTLRFEFCAEHFFFNVSHGLLLDLHQRFSGTKST